MEHARQAPTGEQTLLARLRPRLAAGAGPTLLFLLGAALIGYALGVAVEAAGLTFDSKPRHSKVLGLSALRVALGALFVGSMVVLLRWTKSQRQLLVPILGVGLAARLFLVPAVPPLENDFQRYLWEGGVTAAGLSPYAHSPADAARARTSGNNPRLRRVAHEGRAVLARVDHPQLTSPYPVLTQAAFAVAHFIAPWDARGWKGVLLLFDLATALLLLLLLRELSLPIVWVALYWWNPIVIHEIAGAGHMDVLALPAVLGALLLSVRGRYVLGATCLAVGIGFKLWPVLLLPALLRPAWPRWRTLLPALALAGGALASSVLLMRPGHGSGLTHYAQHWSNNAALYELTLGACRGAAALLGFPAGWGNVWARWVTGGLVLGLALWICHRPVVDGRDLAERALLCAAVLFLLGPTQFPWYYVWLVPLLALRPRLSLLCYAGLLPLFQLNYRYAGLVWVQHLPVLALFGWELISSSASRSRESAF